MTDLVTGIREAFKEFGSNDAQVADAAAVMLEKCALVGGVATLVETGAALTDPKSKEIIAKQKPHLLPPIYERSLADRAFVDRNITARGELVRQVGAAEAGRIAERYGLRSISDTRVGVAPDASEKKAVADNQPNNPWSRAGWNVTKQGALIRSIGVEKASAIARAANSRIGATRAA